MRRALAVTLALLLSACGGGGGGGGSSTSSQSASATIAVDPSATNEIAVTVEQEPDVTAYSTNDIPYVSVTICDASNTCATVNHVVLDTGSYGLRVLKSAVAGLNLPAATVGSATLAECAQFLDGTIWGSVADATVKLGGETASNVPVELVADASLPSGSSATCANTYGNGNDNSSLQGMEANGLLGVGLYTHDGGIYYSCTSTSCTHLVNGTVAAAQQVSNPVPYFSGDNNGVILQMPALTGDVATTAQGVLTFGVGTRSNNAISSFSVLGADSATDFNATLLGSSYPNSFIDSGSNFVYAPISGMPTYQSIYAPSTLTTESITMTPTAGGTSIASQFLIGDSRMISFGADLALDDIAAPYPSGGSGSIDLGFPYFFGRSIAFVISGKSVSSPAVNGPAYAIH